MALIHCIKSLGVRVERIGLEAGPLSQWLYGALRESGLPVELLETRHVKAALSAMPVKTDRNDARGLAQLMRLGWFRPVHCKSMAAQEVRALLTARKLVQSKLYDIEMSLRGILRGFGLRWGHDLAQLCGAHQSSGSRPSEPGNGSGSTLSADTAALGAFKNLEKNVRQISRADARVRLLMSTPGVGPLVALTYISAIDDPKRFTSSKRVGRILGSRRRSISQAKPTSAVGLAR